VLSLNRSSTETNAHDTTHTDSVGAVLFENVIFSQLVKNPPPPVMESEGPLP